MTGRGVPSGYSVPPVVARLVEHAHAHGWRTLLQWCETPEGAPFLKVEVGRRAEPDEGRGPVWRYSLTWHSWDLPHGRLRLFRSGTAETPQQPRAHDAPSVTRICRIIAAHPAPEQARPPTLAQRAG